MISGEEREIDLMIESANKQTMQTKFKKGDPIEVVDKLHPFYGWMGTVKKQIDEIWVRVDFDNGQCIDVQKDLIEQYSQPIPTHSPRLASEMTIREHYALAAFHALSMNSNLPSETIAKKATEQADALINALNEKP